MTLQELVRNKAVLACQAAFLQANESFERAREAADRAARQLVVATRGVWRPCRELDSAAGEYLRARQLMNASEVVMLDAAEAWVQAATRVEEDA